MGMGRVFAANSFKTSEQEDRKVEREREKEKETNTNPVSHVSRKTAKNALRRVQSVLCALQPVEQKEKNDDVCVTEKEKTLAISLK